MSRTRSVTLRARPASISSSRVRGWRARAGRWSVSWRQEALGEHRAHARQAGDDPELLLPAGPGAQPAWVQGPDPASGLVKARQQAVQFDSEQPWIETRDQGAQCLLARIGVTEDLAVAGAECRDDRSGQIGMGAQARPGGDQHQLGVGRRAVLVDAEGVT